MNDDPTDEAAKNDPGPIPQPEWMARAHAEFEAALPGWRPIYDGTARVWRLFPGGFEQHGISVEGKRVEVAIARAHWLNTLLHGAAGEQAADRVSTTKRHP